MSTAVLVVILETDMICKGPLAKWTIVRECSIKMFGFNMVSDLSFANVEK